MDTEGIARNIFNIIDASYYIGSDATPEPEPDARNGEYALAYGPNKEIVDTGWTMPNAYVGLHDLTIKWYSSGLNDGDYGLVIEYWKKDSEGNEVLATMFQTTWDGYISDEFGDSIGLIPFAENYQYRIIVKSHPSIPEDEFIAVDYIRVIDLHPYMVNAGYVYGVAGDEGSMALQRSWPEIYTVTGDGSTYHYDLTVNVPTFSGVVFAVPIPCVLGNSDYIAVVPSIASDYSSFVIRVRHIKDIPWSGGVNVLCHLLYYPIHSKL